MHDILVPVHSILRWILMLLLFASLIKSIQGLMSKRAFTGADNKISLFLMIAAHTQLVVGLVLYIPWVSMDSSIPEVRFFKMEHLTMMLLAIALITIGRIRSKKAADAHKKFRNLFIYNLLALILIILAIPWPCLSMVNRPWF